MKIEKLVRIARSMHPCVFDDETILHWISELDGQIDTQVHLLSPIDTRPYELSEDGTLPDIELKVPHPYDALYLQYVLAQFSYYEGEYEKYQNLMQMYNARYIEYVKWVCENLAPSSGKTELAGYYLSAYAIAVKHGYQGSEEEWLASLQGPQGERGERGEQGPPGAMDGTELHLKSEVNGMYARMKTQEVARPVLSLYGDDGDQPVAIFNVAYPQQESDAATKSYVDEAVKNANGTKIPIVTEIPANMKDGDMAILETEDGEEDLDAPVTREEMETYVDETVDALKSELSTGGGAGKEWLCLINTTFEEDVRTLEVTTDINGNEFSVDELFMRIYIVSPAGGGDINVRFGDGELSANGFFSSREKCYGCINICKKGNKWILDCSASHSTSLGSVSRPYVTIPVDSAPTITNFTITTSSSNSYFAIGSRIEIWGLKA